MLGLAGEMAHSLPLPRERCPGRGNRLATSEQPIRDMALLNLQLQLAAPPWRPRLQSARRCGGARTAGRHRASQAFSAGAPAGFGPACGRGAGALGFEHDGSRPAPPGPRPGRRSARRHGPPPAWPPLGSGPSSRPPRHPATTVPSQRVDRGPSALGDQRPGGHPDRGQPKNSPEMEGKAGTAGMVAAGGIDQQDLGGDRQGARGLLEQRPSRRASRVGGRPAGGPTGGHPGQQAATVRDRGPGEPRSPAAPAPWTRSKQTKQAPIRNTVVGGCQRPGVISPRACCSWVSSSAVAGQVAMPDSVRRFPQSESDPRMGRRTL